MATKRARRARKRAHKRKQQRNRHVYDRALKALASLGEPESFHWPTPKNLIRQMFRPYDDLKKMMLDHMYKLYQQNCISGYTMIHDSILLEVDNDKNNSLASLDGSVLGVSFSDAPPAAKHPW